MLRVDENNVNPVDIVPIVAKRQVGPGSRVAPRIPVCRVLQKYRSVPRT